jgi:hypothetical protein
MQALSWQLSNFTGPTCIRLNFILVNFFELPRVPKNTFNETNYQEDLV